MKIVENYLKLLSGKEIKDVHVRKLLCAVKYYLSRACSTVRDPRIIQTNHYVDEVFINDKVTSKHIVLSPSRVPFPVAYFVNFTLIKNNESKFFYLNDKDEIVIHPYEVVIPVFVALFSGPVGRSVDECVGRSFLSCVLVSGEIAVALTAAGLLERHESVCVAAVVVIAAVWNLSRPTVAYLLDDLVCAGGRVDMQACLQAVSVACCHPNWFVDDYHPSTEVETVLSFVESHIVAARDNDFPGLLSLLFCCGGLSPIGSLLAAALDDVQTGKVSIVVPRDVFIGTVGSKGDQEYISSMQRQLSRFIAGNRSKQNSISDMVSYDMTKENINEISIEAVEKGPLSIPGKIIIKGQVNKEYSLREMSLILTGHEHLLMPKIEWDLQLVLGVCAADIVIGNIDSLLTQSSLVKALELVFSRPALD